MIECLRPRLGFIAIFTLTLSATAVERADAELFHAQGEMTGEVSETSAIVQSRLTAVDRNVDGDVPGAAGVARFEYSTNDERRTTNFRAVHSLTGSKQSRIPTSSSRPCYAD